MSKSNYSLTGIPVSHFHLQAFFAVLRSQCLLACLEIYPTYSIMFNMCDFTLSLWECRILFALKVYQAYWLYWESWAVVVDVWSRFLKCKAGSKSGKKIHCMYTLSFCKSLFVSLVSLETLAAHPLFTQWFDSCMCTLLDPPPSLRLLAGTRTLWQFETHSLADCRKYLPWPIPKPQTRL